MIKYSSIYIGLILIGFFAAGYVTIVGQFAGDDGYNVDIDTTTISAMDSTSNITAELSENVEDILSISINPTDFVPALGSVADLVKNIFLLPFALGNDLITFFSSILGLSAFVTSFLRVIFVVVIVFGFFAIILRWDP